MGAEIMAVDGRLSGRAIHASAVAIGDHALIIRGPSKSGKSNLAVALIGASSPRLPIVLIGDDRLLLQWRHDALDDGLYARPHPRIAGFIERRGLGLVVMPFRDQARVAGLVSLGPATTKDEDLQNFPEWRPVNAGTPADCCQDVLAWFTALTSATCATQRRAKMIARDATMLKD